MYIGAGGEEEEEEEVGLNSYPLMPLSVYSMVLRI